MPKLKQILKNTPLYLFTTFNILVIWVHLCLIEDITDEYMPWGNGDLGWAFKGPWYYVLSHMMWIMLWGAVIYISLKLRYKHLLWATLLSFSSVVYLIINHFFLFGD